MSHLLEVAAIQVSDQRTPIALIPAAGTGSRLPGLRGSKEILEVASTPLGKRKPALQHLLESISDSGIEQIVVITRPEKTDLLDFIASVQLEAATVRVEIIGDSPSVPHTLLQALEAYTNEEILVTLPDILFYPSGAIRQLLGKGLGQRSDILLGVFPTDRPDKTDVVVTDASEAVTGIVIKKPSRSRANAWIMSLWNPAFTRYMISWLKNRSTNDGEPQLGNAFIDAIAANLRVHALTFPHGGFIDIGTPDDLRRLQTQGLRPADTSSS